ncbi:hypothetical protein Agau_L100461 [Agrobacterium tumefaciens F2]|nr:hypothetical protein Agau_L100461 [Agrobacterium tumefaciens F2]
MFAHLHKSNAHTKSAFLMSKDRRNFEDRNMRINYLIKVVHN